MRVIIVTWGREFPLEISPGEPVLEIKRKIEHLLSVPVRSQTLSVQGWDLVDGLDMDYYPIVTEGARIDLTIQINNLDLSKNLDGGKIPIVIKLPSRQINIEVDMTESVRSLKEKIHILGRVPIKRMLLYFSGTQMEDEFRNITEYGIRQSSEVVVFLNTVTRPRDQPLSRMLSVVVETSSSLLNAARIPLELKDSCSVNELKELLVSSKILPQDDYIFIHKQRIMRDSCSLRWHGVENGDSLYVFRGTVTCSA